MKKNNITKYFLNRFSFFTFALGVVLATLIVTVITFANRGIPQKEIGNIEFKSENFLSDNSYFIKKELNWVSKDVINLKLSLNSVSNSNIGSNNLEVMIDNHFLSGDRKEKLDFYIENLTSSSDHVDSLNYPTEYLFKNAVDYAYKHNQKAVIIIGYIPDNSFSSININDYLNQYASLNPDFSSKTVNIIQYDLGDELIEPLNKINCNKWIADSSNIDSVLNQIRYKLGKPDTPYDSFKVEEVIDEYFDIYNNDVSVSKGNISIVEENGKMKIIWKLGDEFYPGDQEQLNVKLKLKNSYQSGDGYYSTSYQTNTSYKIGNEINNETHDETPVIKNYHNVYFNLNASNECDVNNFKLSFKTFEEIDLNNYIPTCDGYTFKGWVIDSENAIDNLYTSELYYPVYNEEDDQASLDDIKTLSHKNEKIYIMPSFDIAFKGTWTKNSIVKNSEGNVIKGTQTSHNIISPVRGSNVIFSNICWENVENLDDGSMKLIYNGIPNDNNQCTDNSNVHGVVNNIEKINLSDEYYYSDAYEYDEFLKKFILKGNAEKKSWNDDTYQDLIGKYTCKEESIYKTCDQLYYIKLYADSTNAMAFPISVSTSDDYRFIANIDYNTSLKYGDSDSMGYVGYMFNKPLKSSNYAKYMRLPYDVLTTSNKNKDFYYASEYTFENGVYSLTNPTKIGSTSNTTLAKKYTFLSTDSEYTSDELYYIIKADSTSLYYIQLYDGNEPSTYNTRMYYGTGLKDNEDGTFTLTGTNYINIHNWPSSTATMKNKFTCNSSEKTCSNPRFITETTTSGYTYNPLYVYGNSVVYDNTTGLYSLTDKISLVRWSNAETGEFTNSHYLLDTNHHYTCFNDTGICDKVYYISEVQTSYANAIELENGDTIIDYVNSIINSSDVNKYDSIAKNIIEEWYRLNLLNQTINLVDTVYCNDRTINDYGMFNKDGGIFGSTPSFNNGECINNNDKFTVSSEKGNGKLKYPVGIFDAGPSNSNTYWLGNPVNLVSTTTNNGSQNNNNVAGIRPVIVVKPNYKIVTGNGYSTDPFVINYE